MASSLANDYLEVVEIVVYDWHDRRNENVVKSEDESDHKEQEMEVDTGGGEQGSERVQQSSEENNVPDVPEAHVTPWRRDAGGRQKCTSSWSVSSEFPRRLLKEVLENNH